jgi:hypothetical protein
MEVSAAVFTYQIGGLAVESRHGRCDPLLVKEPTLQGFNLKPSVLGGQMVMIDTWTPASRRIS